MGENYGGFDGQVEWENICQASILIKMNYFCFLLYLISSKLCWVLIEPTEHLKFTKWL